MSTCSIVFGIYFQFLGIYHGALQLIKLYKDHAIVLFIALSFILIIYGHTWADENTQTVKKDLPAVKTEQPPDIDGVLNDGCWQDTPLATDFTDQRTETLAKNQSVSRIVYTDQAIYVGLHLYDDIPDEIVARQTKDQTGLGGEDWVYFSLDPFHTHQNADRNFFMVNPIGTKYAHLATGRAAKSEWIGLWKATAQIVEDGWVVEMEIPWQMLDYPDTKKPVRMGINFGRFQQRMGEHSWWCNLGVQEFRENDGHWIDVLPPSPKRSLKFLSYLLGSISETEMGKREYTARAGGDIRFEITPQLRLIGTVNPDFGNIEQSVEGIDFSYGERFVSDWRPFFLEGGNVYNVVGGLFHSTRIVDMDTGLKLFGKVGKSTSVGALGTYHKNNQNFVLHAKRTLTETSNLSTAFFSHHLRETSANNVAHISGDVRFGKILTASSFTQSWAEKSDGRAGNVSMTYKGSLLQPELALFFTDPDFVNNLGFHPFTNFRGGYIQTTLQNDWREGYIRNFYMWSGIIGSNTYEGDVFRRNLGLLANLLTHTDYRMTFGWNGGKFGEYFDSVFNIGITLRASDSFNNVSFGYNWGEQADERIHRINGNLILRLHDFTVGLSSSIQWHFDRRYQQILTLTYDFTPALSLGSRLIWQVKGVNVYFILRRSGYAGTDYFIILGDPNTPKVKLRLVAKVIRAF